MEECDVIHFLVCSTVPVVSVVSVMLNSKINITIMKKYK